MGKADSKLNSATTNPDVNMMILLPNLSDKVLIMALPIKEPRKSKEEDTVP